jgi:hypothetical protein
VKAAGARYVAIAQAYNDNNIVYLDLQTGTIGTPAGIASNKSASIVSIGNGWFRCTLVGAPTTIGGSFRVYITDALGSLAYTGDGYSGIYIWGAQLEAGAFATPYIPTVAAQVTRLADSAVMTGVNFSSWFNPEQGCLFVDGRRDGTSNAFPNLAVISDGTVNNRILVSIFNSNNQPSFDVITGNVTQCSLSKPNIGAGIFAKVSGSYQTNNFAMTTNGAAVETDTSGTIPVVNQLRIGSNAAGNVDLNGYIKRLTYYNQALTADNLTAVTR